MNCAILLNINSLLPTIDQLRNITGCYNAVVIGITDTKLDNTVYDPKVYTRIEHSVKR